MCFDDQGRLLDNYFRPVDAYDAIIDPLRMNARMVDPGEEAVRDELFRFLGRDTDRMIRRVSGTERSKLETYLEALNGLGDRIMNQPEIVLPESELPDRPVQSPEFEAMVDHYFEMIRVSFWADTHRVAVLGLGEGIDAWSWRDKNGSMRAGNPWGENFHHDVAHHGNDMDEDPDPRLAFGGWVDWYVHKIVELVELLRGTPDVDGKTLLDNTVIMLTGEVGSGTHDRRRKLHTLIGGGERLRRGRWIETPGVDPRQRDGVFLGGQTRDGQQVESGLNYGKDLSLFHTADVLKAVAKLAGVELDRFGLAANNLAPMPLDLS